MVRISAWTCDCSSSCSLYSACVFIISPPRTFTFWNPVFASCLSRTSEVRLRCAVPCSQENKSHLHLLPQQTWQPPTSSTQSCPPTLESGELSCMDPLLDVPLPYQYLSIDASISPLSNAKSLSVTSPGRLLLAHHALGLGKRRRSMCVTRMF
jgi:hypothetical protein